MLAGKRRRDDRERLRLERLREVALLGDAPQAELDALTRFVAEQLAVPVALLSLTDGERHLLKARHGLSACELPAEGSLCDHVVSRGVQLVVEDARADTRFARCALVQGEPHARFYAGVPLSTHDGLVLGALHAIDRTPRRLSAGAEQLLWTCATQAVGLLELLLRQQRVRRELEARVHAPQPAEAPEAAYQSLVAERMPKSRVLIVDDEAAVARALSRVLGREHLVSTEEDPRHVRPRILAGEQFDVLVSDLMMPHLTGPQLYEQLTALDPSWAERFLFVTGGATHPAVDAFLERVDNECLVKPISMYELRRAVHHIAQRVRSAP